MKLFDKGELKLLWPFYIEYFIASLLFFMPAFMILYLSKLEISFFQIGSLMAIIPIATLIFEIPTGAIADLYGRKFSVLVGYFLEGICMLLLFFTKNYYYLAIIFALWGIGMTFSSGAKDAWVVDLINKKNKKLVHNFFNKMQIFIKFGLMFSGIIGAFFVNYYGLNIIWLVAALSYLISIFLLSIFTKEYYIKEKLKIRESFKNVLKQSNETVSYSYKHHVLFYYIFAAFLLTIAMGLSTQLSWTPLLKELGFPDSYFGYLWSMMAFFSMIAPMISSKFLKRGKEKKFMIISLALSAITTLFIILPKEWIFAIIILAISIFFIDLRTPASEVYFHRFIPSKLRATMGSMRSIIISLGAIMGSIVAGYFIDLIGPRYTILLYVPLIMPIIILYLKIKEEKK
jgi:MFS family permease